MSRQDESHQRGADKSFSSDTGSLREPKDDAEMSSDEESEASVESQSSQNADDTSPPQTRSGRDLKRRSLHYGSSSGSANSPNATQTSPPSSPDTKLYPDLSEMKNSSFDIAAEIMPTTGMSKESPEATKRKPRSPIKEQSQWPYDISGILLFVALVALIGAVVKYFPMESSGSELKPKEDILQSFKDEVKHMKEQFPNQNSRLWATLSSSTKRIIIEDQPSQPAVILIASSLTDQTVSACLARELVHRFSKVHGKPVVTVNITSELSQFDPEEAKYYLMNKMHDHLRNVSMAVILYGVHDLDGKAAMFLHGFCDNDNAPYKKALLVFTVYFDGIEPGSELQQVEKRLEAVWQKSLIENDSSALLSRVGNNIVFVAPEPEVKNC